MKKRKITAVITLLIMLTVSLSIGIYAYWAGGITGASKEVTPEITVGTGQTAETALEVVVAGNEGTLVPEGRAVAGQVESITFTLDFVWEETTADFVNGATGDFVIVATPSNALLQVTLTDVPTEVVLGTTYTITVVVTLDEPADQVEYDTVAGQTLTVLFNLTVSNPIPN